MKILITGISGLLGTELNKALCEEHEVVGVSNEKYVPGVPAFISLDITDQEAVYAAITKANPDIVINTAGMTNVDGCEKDPDLAYRVNALGARNIALACQRFDTVLCHISTDYVFSDEKAPEGGYTEFDPPSPVSVYARSKAAGEEYVARLVNKYFIVRTAWLYGGARSNFVLQNAQAFSEGKTVNAATDMVSSPTYVKDLAGALEELIGTNRFGIYHLTNGGWCTRYDVAAHIADLVGAPHTLIRRIRVEELKLPAHRPKFSGLKNYVWQLDGHAPLRPWQEAVEEFLVEQKII